MDAKSKSEIFEKDAFIQFYRKMGMAEQWNISIECAMKVSSIQENPKVEK